MSEWSEIYTFKISKINGLENIIKKYDNKRYGMFTAIMSWLYNYIPAFKTSNKCSVCELPSTLTAIIKVTERNYIAEDMITTMIDLKRGHKIDELIKFIETFMEGVESKQIKEDQKAGWFYAGGYASVAAKMRANATAQSKTVTSTSIPTSTPTQQPKPLDPDDGDYFGDIDYGDLQDQANRIS